MRAFITSDFSWRKNLKNMSCFKNDATLLPLLLGSFIAYTHSFGTQLKAKSTYVIPFEITNSPINQ